MVIVNDAHMGFKQYCVYRDVVLWQGGGKPWYNCLEKNSWRVTVIPNILAQIGKTEHLCVSWKKGHSIVYNSSPWYLAPARITSGKATFLLCRQPQNSKNRQMMYLVCISLTLTSWPTNTLSHTDNLHSLWSKKVMEVVHTYCSTDVAIWYQELDQLCCLYWKS